MSALASRLARLEARLAGEADLSRIICVSGSVGASSEAIDAFLETQGIRVTAADQVAYIGKGFPNEDGTPASEWPFVLHNVTPCRKR